MLVEQSITLTATPGDVRRALEELDATYLGDATFSLPVDRDPAADGYLRATLALDDDGNTEVLLAAGNGLDLPFFHSIVSSAVSIQYQQEVDRLAAQLLHTCGDGPPPKTKPLRHNPLLPPVPYTHAQAVGLSTAGFAVAVGTFGQAIVGQYSKGIQDTFFGINAHHADTKLTTMLAVIRIGALIALAGGVLSDRIGRRKVILLSLLGLSAMNLVSAIAPDPVTLTALQTLARGFALSALFVGSVVALEEAPERARGFATSMLALAGGFGFTIAVVLLPFAGKHSRWRFVFLLSALAGVLVLRIGKYLKESERFEGVERAHIRKGRIGEVLGGTYRRRFILLAAIGFLTNILTAPSSVLTNNYLKDVHHFSYTTIVLWRMATTSYTGLIGLAMAGTLIERYGRRPTAFVALTVGSIVRFAFYLGGGPVLWLASAIGDMAFACGFLAIGTQNVELFPTEARGTSIGLVNIISVLGSIVGLLAAGIISDHLGGLGHSLAICTIPTLLAALFIVPFLPETRGRDLDEISPSQA